MNDVAEWLESDAGQDWSRKFHHIGSAPADRAQLHRRHLNNGHRAEFGSLEPDHRCLLPGYRCYARGYRPMTVLKLRNDGYDFDPDEYGKGPCP